MLSRSSVEATLRKHGLDLQTLATRPENLERAVGFVYKCIPIPWRWFVGKKRVRRTLMKYSARKRALA